MTRPEGDVLIATIFAAALKLDLNNDKNFTTDGRPQVSAIEAILGFNITAGDRDVACPAGYRDGAKTRGDAPPPDDDQAAARRRALI